MYLFFLTLTSLAAAEGSVQSWRLFDENTQKRTFYPRAQVRSDAAERLAGLNYLNTMRTAAGMIPFTADSLLDTASQNHINYLIYHDLFGHYEDQTNYPYLFTGTSPGDRMTAAGYSWTSYGENLSAGDADIYEAIDGLMSAIYHRFGFLTFLNDDIGIGSGVDGGYPYGSAFGFDMGNNGSWSTTQTLNPLYAAWPAANYKNAQTSFNNYESPDPTPECPSGGITGNPVSLGFNSSKTGTITMSTFKLFNPDGSEITNTKILTYETDPNNTPNDGNPSNDYGVDSTEFVLFPMTSLSLDTKYRAEFNYTESGTPKTLSWYFNTRRFNEKRYEVSHGNTYDVISGQSYIIHLKPQDCNVPLSAYGWNNGSAVIERLDLDLFRISITSDTTFTFNSGNFVFTLHVAPTDNAIAPSNQSTGAMVPVIFYLLN